MPFAVTQEVTPPPSNAARRTSGPEYHDLFLSERYLSQLDNEPTVVLPDTQSTQLIRLSDALLECHQLELVILPILCIRDYQSMAAKTFDGLIRNATDSLQKLGSILSSAGVKDASLTLEFLQKSLEMLSQCLNITTENVSLGVISMRLAQAARESLAAYLTSMSGYLDAFESLKSSIHLHTLSPISPRTFHPDDSVLIQLCDLIKRQLTALKDLLGSAMTTTPTIQIQQENHLYTSMFETTLSGGLEDSWLDVDVPPTPTPVRKETKQGSQMHGEIDLMAILQASDPDLAAQLMSTPSPSGTIVQEEPMDLVTRNADYAARYLF